jgi:hypothetical protein
MLEFKRKRDKKVKYKKGQRKKLIEKDLELGIVVVLCSVFLISGGFISRSQPQLAADTQDDVPPISGLFKLSGQVFVPEGVSQSDSEKPEGLTKLQEFINSINAGEDSGKIGIYVKDLITGEEASSNAANGFNATSFDSLFIVDAVKTRVAGGTLSYSQNIDVARGLSLDQCLDRMLESYSDSCTSLVRTLVEDDLYYSSLANLGFKNSFFGKTEDKNTNVADAGKAMEDIFSAWQEQDDYKPREGELGYSILTSGDQSLVLKKLPLSAQAVYNEARFGGYLNSVAVLYTDSGPVLVSIMSGEWQRPNDGAEKISELYRQIYEYY